MTSTEMDLIESQRTELLELGFRQRHGFEYYIHLNVRSVEASIGSDGVWTLTVLIWASGRGYLPVDEMRLSPGIALPTFVAVVGSLL